MLATITLPQIQNPLQAYEQVQIQANQTTQNLPRHYPYSVKAMRQNEQDLIVNCENKPSSASCTYNIQYALWYLRKKHLRTHLPNAVQSAKAVLNTLYNGKNAPELLLQRINTINHRANFFATNDFFYQHASNSQSFSGASFMPVRWFGVADKVSRECLTGLGEKHCASYIPFGASKVFGNPDIYGWRQAGGTTLLANGFANFKSLFNGNFHDPIQWDIGQLNTEQSLLQPIHEKYLAKYPLFRIANKTVLRLRLKGGVEILNKADRIRYGCHLLRYSQMQGCGD